MKKFLALFSAILLVVGMCACSATNIITEVTEGEVDSAALRADLDAAAAYIESSFDINSVLTAGEIDDQGSALYKNWLSEDIANNEIPMDVEVDGKTITIGKTTVADLKNMDFELDLTVDTVEPDYTQGFTINKGDKFCNLLVCNNTDKAQKIDDMAVTEIMCGAEEFNIPFTYSGLSSVSTLKDVIDTLGAPQSSVTLCSDSTFGTTIDLEYYRSEMDGTVETSDCLTIHLIYDADKNSAAIGSMQLNHQIIDYSIDGLDEEAE